jgi:GAF domain-containing protein
MVAVTRKLAERVSDAARLGGDEESLDAALQRLADLAVELIPGATAAAVTIAGDDGTWTSASDPRIEALHKLQVESGAGPVIQTLRTTEPCRVADTSAEHRWGRFCRAAALAGLGSCLVMPLRADRGPAGTVAVYARDPNAFRGAAHDIALLFAAQGGAAVDNAAVHQACLDTLQNLHVALASRAVIEQAKGMLHAATGCSPEEAFLLLSRASQNGNRKVREVAADLVEGRLDPGQLGAAPGDATGA